MNTFDRQIRTRGRILNLPLKTWIKEHPLLTFFFLSYALAWVVWVPVGILRPNLMTTLSLVGAWAPTLSAVLLAGIIGGRASVGKLIRRGFHWRTLGVLAFTFFHLC